MGFDIAVISTLPIPPEMGRIAIFHDTQLRYVNDTTNEKSKVSE